MIKMNIGQYVKPQEIHQDQSKRAQGQIQTPSILQKVKQTAKPQSAFLQLLKTPQPPSRSNKLSNNYALKPLQKIAKSSNFDIVIKTNDLMNKKLKSALKLQGAYRIYKTRKAYKVMLKQYKYRRSVILELISTEEGYVKDLDIIILQILQPLKENKIITDQQAKVMSSNIYALRKLNGEFLDTLKNHFTGGYVGPYQLIGDLLQDYVPFFKIYFQFYNDYKKIDEIINQLKKENTKYSIQSIYKVQQVFSKYEYLDLVSFMVKPVQRLPKYVLLLNDLLKHTNPSHPDYENILKASKSYSDVANANNENLDKVTLNSKLFELQKEFPQVKIVGSNRDFISEFQSSIFLKDKLQPVFVYLLSDLIIVAVRNDKPQLKSYIILNNKSVVKGLEDTQYFSNRFTIIGENDSITFSDQNMDYKEIRIAQIEQIIQILRLKSDQRTEALQKNLIKVDNKTHLIDVTVVGTEQRQTIAYLPYTVYIIEIMISNISQNIYIRYSEILDVQVEFKKYFPKLLISHLEVSRWHSGKSAKEVETRAINITSFLSSLLQSLEFRCSPINGAILLRLGLPINFYQQPDMLIEEQDLTPISHRQTIENKDTLIEDNNSPLKRSNNIDLDTEQVDVRFQRKTQILNAPLSMRKVGSGIFDKKVSSSALLRTKGGSIERYQSHQSPEGKKMSNKKEVSMMIHVISFHPTKPSIPMQINAETKTSDLYQLVVDEFEMTDIFDFKFLCPIGKTKTFRPLADDEILINLFNNNTLIEKLLNEKKEIHFRKYLFLYAEQEELQLQLDPVKLSMVYPQFLNELEKYYLNFKDYCLLAAKLFYINEIPVSETQKIPLEKLSDLVPSSILKNTKKELWQQFIPGMYNSIVEQFSSLDSIDPINYIQFVKIQFITMVYQNQMCGKQLFQVQPSKDTQIMLKTNDNNLFLGVCIQGLIIFDQRKKTQLLQINYVDISSIKPFAGSLQIEQTTLNKYAFNCSNGYQITQLADEYILILETIKQSVDLGNSMLQEQ